MKGARVDEEGEKRAFNYEPTFFPESFRASMISLRRKDLPVPVKIERKRKERGCSVLVFVVDCLPFSLLLQKEPIEEEKTHLLIL